jgi:hypothetical protein
MTETDWFEDRSADEPPRTVKLGWLIWAVAGLAMLLTPLLYGCTTVEGICAVQPIGQDERGIAYYRYHCEPT